LRASLSVGYNQSIYRQGIHDSHLSHFTLFGQGQWWEPLPNHIHYTPGM